MFIGPTGTGIDTACESCDSVVVLSAKGDVVMIAVTGSMKPFRGRDGGKCESCETISELSVSVDGDAAAAAAALRCWIRANLLVPETWVERISGACSDAMGNP
jgi:hypothetical protein